MLKLRELTIILAVTLVLAFTISLFTSLQVFLVTLLTIFLVILINIAAKKISAFFLETEIEVKLFELKRYGLLGALSTEYIREHPSKKFKSPIPLGVILPLIVTVITWGNIYWLASLVFDVKKKVYRAARRWGLYTFSEITEWHIGWIAAWGIIANLFFALVGYLTGFTEFAKLNIYFAFFNMLPILDLDGNKIFFAGIVLWSALAIVVLIAMFYALLII